MRALALAALVIAAPLAAQTVTPSLKLDNLEPINATAREVRHAGRNAVLLTEIRPADTTRGAGSSIALVKGARFAEGTIEVELAGQPMANADTSVRGFVGLAFHTTEGTKAFKLFYLRPTNARSDDQARRNRTAQYTSEPEWPWFRLRRENPVKWESYVDVVPGAWTKLRIEFRAGVAKLFVHDATQPTLVITDLKSSEHAGGVALWVGPGSEAYFSNLRIRARAP